MLEPERCQFCRGTGCYFANIVIPRSPLRYSAEKDDVLASGGRKPRGDDSECATGGSKEKQHRDHGDAELRSVRWIQDECLDFVLADEIAKDSGDHTEAQAGLCVGELDIVPNILFMKGGKLAMMRH